MKLRALVISSLIIAGIESKPLISDEFEANEIEYGRGKKSKESSIIGSSPSELNVSAKEIPHDDVNSEGTSTDSPPQLNSLPNLLLPLLQRFQFSPQIFFQDRLKQLKESLGNLGVNLPASNVSTSKQFAATNGLLHLVGLNDSGFYTDRLEPAGFLGGNGWFANKGGILGGPGAILSTGSLLTDYPTPYRKK